MGLINWAIYHNNEGAWGMNFHIYTYKSQGPTGGKLDRICKIKNLANLMLKWPLNVVVEISTLKMSPLSYLNRTTFVVLLQIPPVPTCWSPPLTTTRCSYGTSEPAQSYKKWTTVLLSRPWWYFPLVGRACRPEVTTWGCGTCSVGGGSCWHSPTIKRPLRHCVLMDPHSVF